MADDIRLAPLGEFTPEGKLTPGYGDTYIFHVGRDDCHKIMHYLFQLEKMEHDFNMYGFDDEQLNQDIIDQIKNPIIVVQGTLDKSQVDGVHEGKIVAADKEVPGFSNSIAIGESATHQISHTKGGVLVGLGVAYEGSMNWSAAGEGQGINITGKNQPKGFKAQNNTLVITTNPVFISRFRTQLGIEHRIALAQMKGAKNA